MKKEDLKKMSKPEVMNFIRRKLTKDGRPVDRHLRFDMSGYEDYTGETTVNNLLLINTFAYLGIYDYTDFLTIDFYKGTGIVYLKWFGTNELVEYNYSGYGTTEIIYEIFSLTILSDRRERRRN